MVIPSEQVSRDHESRIDLGALALVLWGHKYIVAAGVLLCGLVAVVIGLIATPIYRAEAVVTEFRDEGGSSAVSLVGQLGGLASLAGVSLPGVSGSSRDAEAILESRYLVEEFVRRHDLLPVLFPEAQSRPTLWRGAEKFRNSVLAIRENKIKGTTTIAISWVDAKIAAQWANDYVALANELVRNRALDESTRNIAYLNQQIAQTNVVEVRRALYELIEAETKTLMLANGRKEYAFTVIDPAVPAEIRSSPKRTLMVLLGLLLGLIAGGGAAVLYDRVIRLGNIGARDS